MWRKEPATDKQLAYIATICDEIGGEFHGKTKGEAADFINSNIEKYKQHMWELQLQHEAQIETLDVGRDW